MAISNHKIEIIQDVNDSPSVPTDSDHPDGAYVTSKYNALVDEINAYTTNQVPEGLNLYYTDSRARLAISVTGSGSYDSGTGIITINNADYSIDHVSLIDTTGLVDTYEIWGDSGKTQSLGTFTVTNGDSASDSNQLRLIEQGTPPAPITDRIQIFATDQNELRFLDDNGNSKLVADLAISYASCISCIV